MQVKRFFAADMRQAMKLVRDELGPDAAILGNRRVAGGIELTAALDYQAPLAPSKPNPALEVELRKTQARIAQAQADLSAPARATDGVRKDRQMYGTEAPRRSAAETLAEAMAAPAAPTPAAAGQQALEAMRFELNGLRELIEVQLGSIAWSQLQHQRPQQANLWRRLQRMGLPAELCSRCWSGSPPWAIRSRPGACCWRTWRARSTPRKPDPLDAGRRDRPGRPGRHAGKTTTLAKMAARYVLKYGAQSLALVSMDSFRIGAQEQIKTLGRILNVPVTLVDPGQSLIQALAPLARKRLVLIDTAGLPASDPALRMQLEALASPSLNVKNYLVMATTSQSQVLKSAYQTYRPCGLAGCILTKLDEAGSLGEALALAIGQRLPVAYLADGPRIPDDLQVARAHQLVSRAVSLQAPEEPSEDAMAEMFAGLYQQPARRAS